MAKLKGLSSIVSELRAERTNLVNELKHVEAALSVLGKVNAGSPQTKVKHPTRIISAASRRKMARAQKARWAKVRKASQPDGVARTTGSAQVKRTMSVAARRKIAAAQRARWAKVKAGRKAA